MRWRKEWGVAFNIERNSHNPTGGFQEIAVIQRGNYGIYRSNWIIVRRA